MRKKIEIHFVERKGRYKNIEVLEIEEFLQRLDEIVRVCLPWYVIGKRKVVRKIVEEVFRFIKVRLFLNLNRKDGKQSSKR